MNTYKIKYEYTTSDGIELSSSSGESEIQFGGTIDELMNRNINDFVIKQIHFYKPNDTLLSVDYISIEEVLNETNSVGN